MFEEQVLEPGTLSLLKSLGALPELEGFFLVGGTALAIQIGHRKSEDLDFFCRDPFDTELFLGRIQAATDADVLVVGQATNTLNLAISGVKVDLIRHGYPLVGELMDAGNYRMADSRDIAAMKLSAITNRGSRKDFVDLFFLLQQFSLTEMLEFYQKKYAGHDLFPVIRSLTWFEDAEIEPEPVMREAVPWESVKTRIRDEVNALR